MPVAPDRITQALLRHGLRLTPVRHAVLQVLTGAPFALSGPEIEQQLVAGADRVTLFRTLKSFEQRGLLHRVPGETEVVRYAACSIECTAEAHFDNHVHFRCTSCAHTYCLNQVPVPAVALPGSFQVERSQCLLLGTCPHCQAAG